MLLIGDVPSTGQPDFQGRPCLVKNGSSSNAGLMLAALAHQAVATGLDRSPNHPALWSNEFFGPTKPLQIVRAGLFAMEPVHEFAPGLGVVLTCNRLLRNIAHLAILPPKELSG